MIYSENNHVYQCIAAISGVTPRYNLHCEYLLSIIKMFKKTHIVNSIMLCALNQRSLVDYRL